MATIRYEMGREGVQECEARIFIEKALVDEALRAKLGPKLAERCQAILDERSRCISWADEKNTNGKPHCYLPVGPLGGDWYAGSGWRDRTAKLYSAAAAVQERLRQGK